MSLGACAGGHAGATRGRSRGGPCRPRTARTASSRPRCGPSSTAAGRTATSVARPRSVRSRRPTGVGAAWRVRRWCRPGRRGSPRPRPGSSRIARSSGPFRAAADGPWRSPARRRPWLHPPARERRTSAPRPCKPGPPRARRWRPSRASGRFRETSLIQRSEGAWAGTFTDVDVDTDGHAAIRCFQRAGRPPSGASYRRPRGLASGAGPRVSVDRGDRSCRKRLRMRTIIPRTPGQETPETVDRCERQENPAVQGRSGPSRRGPRALPPAGPWTGHFFGASAWGWTDPVANLTRFTSHGLAAASPSRKV